jgi:hypothetical protein
MFDGDFSISALNHADHSTVAEITKPFIAVRIKAAVNHDEPSPVHGIAVRRSDRQGVAFRIIWRRQDGTHISLSAA